MRRKVVKLAHPIAASIDFPAESTRKCEMVARTQPCVASAPPLPTMRPYVTLSSTIARSRKFHPFAAGLVAQPLATARHRDITVPIGAHGGTRLVGRKNLRLRSATGPTAVPREVSRTRAGNHDIQGRSAARLQRRAALPRRSRQRVILTPPLRRARSLRKRLYRMVKAQPRRSPSIRRRHQLDSAFEHILGKVLGLFAVVETDLQPMCTRYASSYLHPPPPRNR